MPEPTLSPESIAAGRYHAYFRGWAHGAGLRALDSTFTNNENLFMRKEYAAGYRAGTTARRRMSSRLEARTGHHPSLLRAVGSLSGGTDAPIVGAGPPPPPPLCPPKSPPRKKPGS